MSGRPFAGRLALPGEVLVREVVRPLWTFRLGRASMDGLLRRRADGLIRLLHIGGEQVVVAVAQPSPDRVVFAARAASDELARAGIARMRFAVGVDDDLQAFHERFREDPVIGAAVRAYPGLRVRRSPDPWETLAWAITEQLIELQRAVLIQRRMIRALGPRCARTGLRDVPAAAVIAKQAPALLESFGLAAKRALAMRSAAAEVAAGRIDWAAGTAVNGTAGAPLTGVFARLLAIREIGPWTVEMLALHGLGRLDVIPAGDLGYLKLVGRLNGVHAEVDDVHAFFEPYAPWAGLAGEYLRLSRLARPRRPIPRAGTRPSAAVPRTAAA
ncbi:DNA-3-methyladenine glycosylase family protein [Candidatus Solirubrobacter pratensis]|uniref:DNA-3-methyladenine glycosylase family protein n=1 Tax=Candidatus Solirubrobacter pratensis TaxID=1298857 RepID=UPI00048904EF|nr:DNA-3-methyladenine glycosylase [Candidatus Solirubrobacter pratensis]